MAACGSEALVRTGPEGRPSVTFSVSWAPYRSLLWLELSAPTSLGIGGRPLEISGAAIRPLS